MTCISRIKVSSTLTQIPQSLKQGLSKVAQAVARILKKVMAAIGNFFARFKASKPSSSPSMVKQPEPKFNREKTSEPEKETPLADPRYIEKDNLYIEKDNLNSPPAPTLSSPEREPPVICSICLDDDEPLKDENAELTRCAHRYHKACLDTWLEKNDTCPLCRSGSPRVQS